MKPFKAGDRVRMTPEGVKAGFDKDGYTTGVVVANPQKPDRVTVVITGRKTADTYAARFWEHDASSSSGQDARF